MSTFQEGCIVENRHGFLAFGLIVDEQSIAFILIYKAIIMGFIWHWLHHLWFYPMAIFLIIPTMEILLQVIFWLLILK